MTSKQRSPIRQWLCLLLAVMLLAGAIPMEVMAMDIANGSEYGATEAISLNGTWEFTPDTEAKSVVIRAGRETDAAPLTPLCGEAVAAKLTVDDPAAVRYGKIMALIEADRAADGKLRTLSAQLNGGEWHSISLDGMAIGRKIWIELPMNPSDLCAGENTISLKATADGTAPQNAVMLYGEREGEELRHCVRIKYYPELPDGWQDMTVPSAWEGNFTLPTPKEDPSGRTPALCVSVNGAGSRLIDLEAYRGQDAALIEIPLELSGLVQGANAFRVASNVTAGPGQGNSTSVDIPFYSTLSGMDVTGSGFYQSGAFIQATTNVPAISLMLKKQNGEWDTVRQYDDQRIGSVVVGPLADNGQTYEIQSALNPGELSDYTEAKLVITAHVGTDIQATSDAEMLLPENQPYPALCVVTNETQGTLVNLAPYRGQETEVEIPLSLSQLQNGVNTFRFDSNVTAGPGQGNDTSVDIPFYNTASGADVTGSGFYQSGAFAQATTNVPAISLMLKKQNGEWDTVRQYQDGRVGSVVVGLFADNGQTYHIQSALNAGDLSTYTEAKLVALVHVGGNVRPVRDPQELLPDVAAPVELKVAVNGGDEAAYDITGLLGSVSLADVELDYASLKTGDNVFALSSNTVSRGQGQSNATSMDIVMATPTTPTGNGTGFWSDSAFNQFQPTEAFHAALLLQRADNDQWVEVKLHQGDNVNNLIVGMLGDNGVTYRPQITLPVDDITAYKAARLQVMLHVGDKVERTAPVQPGTSYDDATSEPITLGDPVLRVGLNTTEDWESYNLRPYAGTNSNLVIPIPVSSLVAGNNEIYFHSNVASRGNQDSTSVDLLIEKSKEYKDSAYSQNGLGSFVDLGAEGRRFKVGLALKRRDTGEWVEARTYGDATDVSLVVGKFAVNGATYIPRVTLPVDDPALYSDAVVLAQVHVGSNVQAAATDSHLYDGVGWYRRTLTLPAAQAGEEQWLHFEAIDYKAEIFLNGCFLGSHEGGYAPFDLPLSALGSAVNAGGSNELVVRVTDQSTDIGRDVIPIKETPAGFLQDTIGINYAGIWGDVSLLTRGMVTAGHLYVDTDIERGVATLTATVRNSTQTERTVQVTGSVTQKTGEANGSQETTLTLAPGTETAVSLSVALSECTLWQLDNPHLYTASLTVSGQGVAPDIVSTDFGMRRIERQDNKIVFNGTPIFLTGWITWMVDWNTIAPAPSVEQTEQRIRELKEAGFNAIKFCLVVPPDYVLDICDRMGIYCYIQYPIWEPAESEDFFTRCMLQLPELVEKDRNHPSVILSDFACELPAFSPEMDAFMQFMIEKAKQLDPNRLFADNSSTGTNKYGDFRTTHPYVGVNEFDSAIDRWVQVRGNYPLVLGEYADSRAMSNRDEILDACGGTPWWWTATSAPPDAYAAFEAQGYSKEQIDAFKDASYLTSLEAKRAYIEDSKKNSSVAALFLTQLVDIKHNSCGFYDELGNLKFDPDELQGSAGETALLMDDTKHNFTAGKTAVITPAISHYNGQDIQNGRLTYALTQGDKTVLAGTAQENISLKVGDYYCLNDLSFLMPDCTGAQQYRLTLTLECDGFTVSNHWDVWGYSAHALRNNGKDIRYFDPDNLYHFAETYPWMAEWKGGQTPDVVITTKITKAINTYLNGGGQVIYLGSGTGPANGQVEHSGFTNFTSSSLIFFPDETHPLVQALSSNGYGGIQFLDLASPHFLPYRDEGGTAIFGRLALPDTRVDSYLSEYTFENGRLLQCTLRLDDRDAHHGGDYLGQSIFYVKAGANPLGTYLIDQMLRYMAGDENEAGVSDFTITPPEKLIYRPGEALDLTGLTASMTDTLGGRYPVKVDSDMVHGYDSNTLGEQTVTVTYEGKQAVFTVTVLDQEMIDRQQAIDDTVRAIEAIGEITKANLLEKSETLRLAQSTLEALKARYGDSVSAEVSNAANLDTAQDAFDALYAEYTAALEALKTQINGIGDITKQNYKERLVSIEAAETALQTLRGDYGQTAGESIADAMQTLSAARDEHDRIKELMEFPYGDIDGNGSIDASDALEALQHSVRLRTLTGDSFQHADVDGNGQVDASDALYILQHSVKLITDFPVQR